MLTDNKIRFIKAKHGLLGYAVYLRLLEEIYKEKGYYIENGEKFSILFCDDNKLELNVFNEILNDCINEELFDSNIYKTYGILTSRRIQQNYFAGCERRQNIFLIKEYLLIDPIKYKEENPKSVKFNVNIITLNANIEEENDNTGTQIEKEIEKEIEIEKIKYSEFVSMKKNEFEKLVDKYGEYNTNKMIEILDNYKGANGKKYKSDYRAILSWVAEKVEKEQPKKKNYDEFGEIEVF